MEQAAIIENSYMPTENEPYMNANQIAYFKGKLLKRKQELSIRLGMTIGKIKTLESYQADILDRSNSYIDVEREVSNFERYSIVLEQIDRALKRIDEGSFGYCELTGDEIGLRRLEAIPFASMSIQALEAFEAEQRGGSFSPRRPVLFS